FISFSISSSGSDSLKRFCQYIYVAFGKLIALRITASRNSFRSSVMILDSVFAGGSVCRPLKLGAFLSKHSLHAVIHFLFLTLVHVLAFSLACYFSFLTLLDTPLVWKAHQHLSVSMPSSN